MHHRAHEPGRVPDAAPSACTLDTQGSFGPDRITKNVYDAAGQLLKVQKAVGTPLQQDEVTYTYSLNGKQTSLTDANGNRSYYAYDEHDRLAVWYFPSKTVPGEFNTADYESYGYDANGNRTLLRKRDGQYSGYAYDALNRMTIKDLPYSANDVAYAYDLRGLQTVATFSAAGVSHVYDDAGRLTSTTSGMGGTSRTLSYGYDANSNRTSITHPDGVTTYYDHDGLDRVTLIREWDNDPLASFGYDAMGRRAHIVRGNGAVTFYAYDGASRLSEMMQDLPGTASDIWTPFGYNPASQISSTSRSNDAYVWTGHGSGSTASTVNGLNQLVTVGGVAFAHDLNGNLTSDGATTYAYDAENRMVSASGAHNATLAYDPLGRLSSIGGTRFLYDGDALVGEYDANGNMVRRYIHGPGVDEPLVVYEAGARKYLIADNQGSIIALTNDAGAVIAYNRYDEYGVPAPGNAGRFGYTGQAWLPEIEVNYYKARMYGPVHGRFFQTDPIGYEDGPNWYIIGHGDPVNKTDPSGQEAACITSGRKCTQANLSWKDIANRALTAVDVIAVGIDLVLGGPTGESAPVLAATQAARTAVKEAAENRAKSLTKGIPESRLGPSGKEKIHQTDHSTLKRAEDSARSRTAKGQSPIKHSNPTKGHPHFHARDAKGNKRQDGIHDNYPGKRLQRDHEE